LQAARSVVRTWTADNPNSAPGKTAQIETIAKAVSEGSEERKLELKREPDQWLQVHRERHNHVVRQLSARKDATRETDGGDY